MSLSSTTEAEVTDEDTERAGSNIEEVMEKADALQEDYYAKRIDKEYTADSMPNFTLDAWLTGLSEGKVIDMDVNEYDDILLEVRLPTDETTTVRVRDSGEYSDKNELARLLKVKNIPEGRVEQLLGENIPLYVDRYALPSNDRKEPRYRIYIPSDFDTSGKLQYKLDTVLRYLGYEGEFQSTILGLAFAAVTTFWWMLLLLLGTTSVFAMNGALPGISTMLTLVTIGAILLTTWTPMILRLARIGYEKAYQFKTKETIFK